MLLSEYSQEFIEAGCDEAGRGCLAGPVYAAAVILPKGYKNPLLRDSKKITEPIRNKLFPQIKKDALAWSVGYCSPKEIDKHNILNASFLAMHKAIKKLSIKPELLLIDGNRFNAYKDIPHHTVIKGDDKYLSIAAASILAKVSRDRYMKNKAKLFPFYDWQTNKGYPTKAHRKAICEHGSCPLHRMSFRLIAKED